MSAVAKQSVSRASLLGLPPEVRLNIYSYLLHPLRYQAYIYLSNLNFLLTCREIYDEAHHLFFSRTVFRLSEWRDSELQTRLSRLKPSTIAAITTLEVEVESWHGDPDDFSPGLDRDNYVEWLKFDDGVAFWDLYEPGEWVLRILGLFTGLRKLTLYSDGHGYIWSLSDMMVEFEGGDEEGEETLEWSVEADEKNKKMILTKMVLENEENDDAETETTERTVVIWVK